MTEVVGIYVLGMHRSGTSALAGLLSALCGLPAGRLAVGSNPAGQWERPELRPALELMLAWNGASWAAPPPEAATLAVPGPLRAYGARVFRRHGAEPFLWKDPRLCLTFDHWASLPQAAPRAVFIHRRPDEVARSLGRRNGWPVDQGLALWERTNRNAIARLAGREVFAVDHATLVTEPDRVTTILADWLGQDDPEARSLASATIEPPSPLAADGDDRAGIELTAAQAALAERLDRAARPAVLSLDGVGPESASTGAILGSPGRLELLRRAARAASAIPRRHHIEIAGQAVSTP